MNPERAITECCTPHNRIRPIFTTRPAVNGTDTPVFTVCDNRKSPWKRMNNTRPAMPMA